MKFASGTRLRPGESPHTHGVSTVPFDPCLGVAGPYDATTLLRVAFDARATLTHPKDAAAGRQGFPKHPIAVRRIVPEHAGDRLACRGVRRSRISGRFYVKY